MKPLPEASTPVPRIALVDLGRGVALIAMTAFHFTWDLAMFRVIPPAFVVTPFMIWSAHVIAGSFLFLVGFSLILAHGDGIRWRPFGRRFLVILVAAGLVTLATWFATPNAFIFFGILHSIALGSVLALAFVFVPWWLTAAAGFAVLSPGLPSLYDTLHTDLLNAPFWWWTGLQRFIPVSNDYVPIFPFFGMILLGLATGQLADWIGAFRWLARPRFTGRPGRLLRFIGRHSLIYYLAHQPVMLAGFFAVFWLSARI